MKLARLFIPLLLLPLACTPTAPAPRGGPASAVRTRAVASTTASRVWFESNVTPTNYLNNTAANADFNGKWVDDGNRTEPDKNGEYAWIRNVPPHDYCRDKGLRPCTIAYEAAFNNYRLWVDDDGGFLKLKSALNRWDVDGSRWGWNIEPVPTNAVPAIANLARHPDTFRTGLAGPLPLIIDIENSRIYNQPREPTLGQAIEQAKAYYRVSSLFRRALGSGPQAAELYWYGGTLWTWRAWQFDADDPKNREFVRIEAAHAANLSGYCVDFYSTDAENAKSFEARVDANEWVIARYYPQWKDKKIALLTCVWSRRFPPHTPDVDKLIPLDTFKDHCRILAARGWVICLWGLGVSDAAARPYVDAAAKFK